MSLFQRPCGITTTTDSHKHIYLGILILFFLGIGITIQAESFLDKLEGKPLDHEHMTFINLSDEYEAVVVSTLTNLGNTFKQDILKETFRNIYELGYFQDIKVDAELVDDKVRLTFIFTEYPMVQHLVFSGNSELSDDDLQEVMQLAPDELFNSIYIERDIARIIDAYREKGVIGTQVNIHSRTIEENKVIIYVDITEGQFVYVERIDIIGTNYLTPRDIKRAMNTRERTFYKSDTVLNREELELDVQRIIDYCHSEGFIEAKVHKPVVLIDKIDRSDPSPDAERGYFIAIEIEEGDRYYMGNIIVDGNEIFSDEQILDQFRLDHGDVFDESVFKEDIQVITEMYNNRGYVNARISPFQKKDTIHHRVDYEIDIYESSKVHIEHIYIRRNDKTKTYVIDRDLRIREGLPLDRFRLMLTQQRLMNLQYFSNVWFEFNPSDEEGLVDLVINVAETRTGMFTMGAGFGSSQGFTVFADIKEINLLGHGIGVGSRVELGQRNTNIQIYGETHWIRYTPLYLRAALGFERYQIAVPYQELKPTIQTSNILAEGDVNADGQNNSGDLVDLNDDDELNQEDLRTVGLQFPTSDINSLTYLSKGFNASGAAGYRFFDYLDFIGRLRTYIFATGNLRTPDNMLNTDLQNYLLKKGSILRNDLAAGWQVQNSILLMFDWNYRDNDFNPTRGSRITAEFESTGGFLFGDKHHMRTKFDFSFYFSPFRVNNDTRDPVFTAVFHASAETLFPGMFDKNGIIDLDEIRLGEMLFFDGLNELRGWSTYLYGSELIGYNKLSAGLELRFPVPYIQQIIWGVLFFDAGTMSYDPHGGFQNFPFFTSAFRDTKQYHPYSGKETGEYETYTVDGTTYRVGLKYSIGFGVRIQIPLLPIRLYFAKKGRQLYDPITDTKQMYFQDGFETVLSVYGLY